MRKFLYVVPTLFVLSLAAVGLTTVIDNAVSGPSTTVSTKVIQPIIDNTKTVQDLANLLVSVHREKSELQVAFQQYILRSMAPPAAPRGLFKLPNDKSTNTNTDGTGQERTHQDLDSLVRDAARTSRDSDRSLEAGGREGLAD